MPPPRREEGVARTPHVATAPLAEVAAAMRWVPLATAPELHTGTTASRRPCRLGIPIRTPLLLVAWPALVRVPLPALGLP